MEEREILEVIEQLLIENKIDDLEKFILSACALYNMDTEQTKRFKVIDSFLKCTHDTPLPNNILRLIAVVNTVNEYHKKLCMSLLYVEMTLSNILKQYKENQVLMESSDVKKWF